MVGLWVQVDHSLIESFAQGGRTCITSRVYPTKAIYGAAQKHEVKSNQIAKKRTKNKVVLINKYRKSEPNTEKGTKPAAAVKMTKPSAAGERQGKGKIRAFRLLGLISVLFIYSP